MGTYVKRPVAIEARQFDGSEASRDGIFQWLDQHDQPARSDRAGQIVIVTLEGEMEATAGDWIICGVAGEFYPCKPDIFEQTYQTSAEAMAAECERYPARIVLGADSDTADVEAIAERFRSGSGKLLHVGVGNTPRVIEIGPPSLVDLSKLRPGESAGWDKATDRLFVIDDDGNVGAGDTLAEAQAQIDQARAAYAETRTAERAGFPTAEQMSTATGEGATDGR